MNGLFLIGPSKQFVLNQSLLSKHSEVIKTDLVWVWHLRRVTKNRNLIVPKMKTKKSAAKRFQVRGSGSIKRGQAFKRHILTKKTTKNKRQLRGSAAVHETNVASVRAMMPFA